MNYLCIDIGGTNIKYAIYDDMKKRKSSITELPTTVYFNNNNILNQLKDLISKTISTYSIKGICLSSSGVIDSVHGIVISAGPTIPNYSGTPIKQEIESTFGIPCEVENDINCALLAEIDLLPEYSRNIYCLTIGTGIGGALAINRNIYHGSAHCAGEIGYLPVDSDMNFQESACTNALINLVNNATGWQLQNGREVMERKDDPLVDQAIHTWLNRIAKGIVMINYVVDPDIFIVGGGIMENNATLISLLEDKAAALVEPSLTKRLSICRATTGNEAGMIGALLNFKQRQI